MIILLLKCRICCRENSTDVYDILLWPILAILAYFCLLADFYCFSNGRILKSKFITSMYLLIWKIHNHICTINYPWWSLFLAAHMVLRVLAYGLCCADSRARYFHHSSAGYPNMWTRSIASCFRSAYLLRFWPTWCSMRRARININSLYSRQRFYSAVAR